MSSQAGGWSAPHGPTRAAEPVMLRGPPSLRLGRRLRCEREGGDTQVAVTQSAVADPLARQDSCCVGGSWPAQESLREARMLPADERRVQCGCAGLTDQGHRAWRGGQCVSPEAGWPPAWGSRPPRAHESPSSSLWVHGVSSQSTAWLGATEVRWTWGRGAGGSGPGLSLAGPAGACEKRLQPCTRAVAAVCVCVSFRLGLEGPQGLQPLGHDGGRGRCIHIAGHVDPGGLPTSGCVQIPTLPGTPRQPGWCFFFLTGEAGLA